MRITKLAILFVAALSLSSVYAEDIVEFHIPAGTANGPYNKIDSPAIVYVGQTLRVINDDTVDHRVHTNGSPCDHGDTMAPGGYWDCKIEAPHRADAKNMYDHNYGPNAQFYVEAIAN